MRLWGGKEAGIRGNNWRVKVPLSFHPTSERREGKVFALDRIGIKVFEFLFFEDIVNRTHVAFHIENVGLGIIGWSQYPDVFFKLMDKFIYNVIRISQVAESSCSSGTG